MPRSSKEAEVRKKVLDYLKTAEQGDPSKFQINVRNVASRVGCRQTLIYMYGLDAEIFSARKRQITNNPEAIRTSKRQQDKNAMRSTRQELEKQVQVNKAWCSVWRW
jgi:hypothetical protein